MRGVTALAVTALCAALLGAADGAAAPEQNVRLTGIVGPGFNIVLRNAEGNTVTRLDPGTYEIVADDRSNEHNFHLTGPGGVDRRTPVEGTGEETWTVTFVDGSPWRHVSATPPWDVHRREPAAPDEAADGHEFDHTGDAARATAGPRPVITLRTAAGKR